MQFCSALRRLAVVETERQLAPAVKVRFHLRELGIRSLERERTCDETQRRCCFPGETHESFGEFDRITRLLARTLLERRAHLVATCVVVGNRLRAEAQRLTRQEVG